MAMTKRGGDRAERESTEVARAKGKTSRRALITGAVTAPLALDAMTRRRTKGVGDPLVKAVAAWIAARGEYEQMAIAWSELESQLATRMRGRLSLARARRSNLADARAMRTLDKQMTLAEAGLEQGARRIKSMRPISLQGALAKLEMCLRIQGRHDWQDHAFGLAEDAFKHLRAGLNPDL